MQIKKRDLNRLLESIAYDLASDDIHQHLHESEGSSCGVVLKRNKEFELKFPVRVVPNADGTYFGGDLSTRGRNRGETVTTLTPGTKLLCLRPSGSEAWFEHPELDAPIRIHINKFCEVARDKQKNRKAPPQLMRNMNSMSGGSDELEDLRSQVKDLQALLSSQFEDDNDIAPEMPVKSTVKQAEPQKKKFVDPDTELSIEDILAAIEN